ncbi:MAG: DUF3795 domain-containing protein [Patescibacteria group bacterium]|nr:DUF3795 domain-containing protein [Patescibacteria group bacterium]MDD4611189.1 DUF3795 domain-containing protein [Patescibacteria group bacterium]
MNLSKEKFVAYCGLYCPTCYKMRISEIAKQLKKKLNFDKSDFLSKEFISDLNKLIKLRCPKICKLGGGNKDCSIKKCCRDKKISGCWECVEFKNCDKLKRQFIDNIKKIKKVGIKKYIQKINFKF